MYVSLSALPASDYDWYMFNSPRNVVIRTVRGRESTLTKGSKFGIRENSKGVVKLVTQEMGLTYIFSVDSKTSASLVRRSTSIRTPSIKNQPKTPPVVVPTESNKYNWYTFNGTRGVTITNSKGDFAIKKGVKFGVRLLNNGMAYIGVEGQTAKYKVERSVADSLIKRSSDSGKTPGGKPDTPAAAPNDASVKPESAGSPDVISQKRKDAKIINAHMPQGFRVSVVKGSFMLKPVMAIRVSGKTEKYQAVYINLVEGGKKYTASGCPAGFLGNVFESWPIKGHTGAKNLNEANLTKLLTRTGHM